MEHIKCRLQVQHGTGSADTLYRGPFDAVHKIVSNHGMSGLFRGMCVTWWREVPAFGMYFSTYDTIKDWGNRMFEDENGEVKDWHAWGASAFAGGFSGCFTWLIICEWYCANECVCRERYCIPIQYTIAHLTTPPSLSYHQIHLIS